MITLASYINRHESDFIRLYENSFPTHERRDTNTLLQLRHTQPEFEIQTICTHHAFAGFITYWDLTDFVFIEHFAVEPALRGQKIGERALTSFVNEIKKPVVLEIEIPTDIWSTRRYQFYTRMGFHRFPFAYRQPPYRQTDTDTPMWLLGRNSKFDLNSFKKVQCDLYRSVYGIIIAR